MTLTSVVATTTNETDSGNVTSAKILNDDQQDFEIETIPDGRNFFVSSEVVGKAMDDGVSLAIGGKVRVTFAADTGTVNRIMDDE